MCDQTSPPSPNVMNFRHLLGCDTIVTTVKVFSLLTIVTSPTVATYVIFHFTHSMFHVTWTTFNSKGTNWERFRRMSCDYIANCPSYVHT